MCAGEVRVFDSEAGFGRTRADGEHVPTKNTCRRRTRADGARATPAASTLPTQKGKSRLPFSFSRFSFGDCVCLLWEALSDRLASYKFSDCRVIRIFLFPCFVYCACKFTAFYSCVIKCAFLMLPFHFVSFPLLKLHPASRKRFVAGY